MSQLAHLLAKQLRSEKDGQKKAGLTEHLTTLRWGTVELPELSLNVQYIYKRNDMTPTLVASMLQQSQRPATHLSGDTWLGSVGIHSLGEFSARTLAATQWDVQISNEPSVEAHMPQAACCPRCVDQMKKLDIAKLISCHPRQKLVMQ